MGFGPGSDLKTIGMIASNRREGVTTICCNLALYAAAQHDWRVLLVDGNRSAPRLHQIFQLQRSPGLAEMLNVQAAEDELVHDLSKRSLGNWPPALRRSFRRHKGLSRFIPWSREDEWAPQLKLLTAGGNDQRPIYGHQNNNLFADLAADVDLVIIDLPAVNSAVGPGFPLSNLDGVLFVLEAEATSDIAAQKSLNHIRDAGGNVLGAVFNKYRSHLPKWIDRRLGD